MWKKVTISIIINSSQIEKLDLSPAIKIIEDLLEKRAVGDLTQELQFEINLNRDSTDPREVSEIPEVRLWFVRLDAKYPWLPLILDWKGGELSRYAAMLVPHQFSRSEGIIYNPEALEIFVMNKVFVISNWFKTKGIESKFQLKSMAQTFGYDLEDSFFELID